LSERRHGHLTSFSWSLVIRWCLQLAIILKLDMILVLSDAQDVHNLLLHYSVSSSHPYKTSDKCLV
jgi:hypothetical protein